MTAPASMSEAFGAAGFFTCFAEEEEEEGGAGD
jgi:hypothetical protein